MIGRVLLLLTLLSVTQAQPAGAQAVRGNPGFTTTSIPRNDDGSFPSAVPIGFTVDFFGERFATTFVNNNGNITFGGPLSTFTPEGLLASPLRIIAPFWADVDTRAAGSALVTFGQDTVDGRRAFGVNYVNVGYFGTHDDKLNSFQLVLIERADIGPGNFDIEFNYDRIEWETGDASGGSGGFGGTPASAGYSNGTGKAEGSFEILGSRRRGIFLDSSRNGLRYRRLNSAVRGRIVFFVRSGSVECSYAALSIDEIFPWQGGTGSTQVASPGGCGWTATSNSSFITITSSADSGGGFVEYLVAPNRSSRPRTGTLTVAGEIITVAQEAFATLRVTPPTIELSSVEGTFPNRVSLRIEPIEESVDWSASARLLNGDVWRLRTTPSSGTATKAAPSILTLEFNAAFPAPLPGVVYEAILTVRDTIEGPAVDVPLILTVSPRSGNLQLSQSAFVFRVVEGGSVPAPQTLGLTNSGAGSLSWTVALSSLQSALWLNFSALAGNAVTGSPSVSSTTLDVNPAGLAPGVYQALVPFSASGGTNDLQLVTVTLHVVPAAAQPLPALSPGGIVFVAGDGGASPAPQSLTISNVGSGSLTFRLGVETFAGGNWLSLSANSGGAGASPAAVQVSANSAGLPPGIYRGRVIGEFSAGGRLDVLVSLVVPTPGSRTLFGTTVCTPQGIDMLVTSVASSAIVALSFPQSLQVRAVDTCGEPVNDALVLAGVEGNRFALRPVGRGLYSGNWTPQLVAPTVPVNILALHPTYGLVNFTVRVSTLEAPGGVTLPAIAADGVTDAAGFTQRLPLAPGSVFAVFGSRLAAEEAFAPGVPLGRQLGGVRVRVGGEDAPLFYVGPDQVNGQVPFTARPGSTVSIVVNSGGKLSAPQNVLIAPVQPSIFQTDGIAFATDQQGRRITSENPARLGQPLRIFATGLGLVEPAASTGAGAPASTTVLSPVRVTIGGVDAPVGFQGLVAGSAGLYQINVTVPGLVRPGDDVPVFLRQSGIPSNGNIPVSIPVRLP
ncbi:MAG: hypothetical protein HW398_452 [Acidobacteria bacterium]|nr:hypothetical protein [Acidobacteriota bacterium]